MSTIEKSTQKEYVILVNERDEAIGTEEKQRAHELGLLHRAFSVFVYRKNQKGIEILLQKRNASKYHCGGLWTNTCCSHPRLNESVLSAAERRLKEEMSLEVPLTNIGSFIYKAAFDNGLVEYEFDHVLLGEYHEAEAISYNSTEVEDCKWIELEELQAILALELTTQNTSLYTPWLAPAFELVQKKLVV